MVAGVQGRVVAITGAARGLGASLARQLTERGARVALLGLEPRELAKVSADCQGSRFWELDVTEPAELASVAAEVTQHFGRIDVLVVNAGVASGGPFLYTDAEAFERTIEVNLMGSTRTLRAFLPALVESKGYSLQIASLAALAPAPMMAAYCASKSGVEAFTESVRTEMAGHGVDFGTAYLSWTDTDMVRGADEHPDMRQARAGMPGVLGIERRAAHVYGQRWVRFVRPIRGLIAGLTYVAGRRDIAKAEKAFLAEGEGAGGLVGAGGRADHEHHLSHASHSTSA